MGGTQAGKRILSGRGETTRPMMEKVLPVGMPPANSFLPNSITAEPLQLLWIRLWLTVIPVPMCEQVPVPQVNLQSRSG